MELFKQIRLRIGNAILKNKISQTKRKMHFTNMNLVRNIGIVWDASRIDDFASLSRFYQKMHENKTEVKIFGYFPGNDLPNQYTAVRYLSILKRKELNIFYYPVSTETIAFVNNPFDVLIDLNFKNLFPLQYVTSLSNAGFKVGLYEAETGDSHFDLMMDMKNPFNVEEYLDHVLFYLDMINSGTVN
jgi:hypothetical protein